MQFQGKEIMCFLPFISFSFGVVCVVTKYKKCKIQFFFQCEQKGEGIIAELKLCIVP